MTAGSLDPVRIAVAQAAGTPADVEGNLAVVRRVATEAAGAGARLVVFPEAFVTGYNIGSERIAELAEAVDGPAVGQLRAAAAEAGIAILCGYCERASGAVYNSAALVGSGGQMLANCRKTHLFGQLDRSAFAAGEGLTLATVEDIEVGVLICYDLEFPEAARQLALRGAQLIAVPTALMVPAQMVAEAIVPARALENQIYVAYANRVGTEGSLEYVGRSCVAGPEGLLASAGASEETVLYADIDAAAIESARENQSYLHDRRPALYEG